MEYLVQFFAWLMEWCHSWCPNYWADIVIFTFLTKILQFPVSLWCQVNSLKMVSLMPVSNRIKMEHYGDGDAIGEETAALFKREKYHPMLSLVPLAIQIVILMAFVRVIYGIGDRLTVYKANMIIPQIAENLTRSGTLEIPEVCPVCGGKTEIRREIDTEVLVCTNPECPAKKIKAFTLFASRSAMNIEGLSEMTLEKFIAEGFIHEFADIYHLDQHRDAIVDMEGFGEKSYTRLIESVERSRQTTLPRLVYALGIAGIGAANARILCNHFGEDLDAMAAASAEEIGQAEGIGPVLAAAVSEWFASEKNRSVLEHLLKEVHPVHRASTRSSRQAEASAESGLTAAGPGEGGTGGLSSEDQEGSTETGPDPIEGKTFVVTGKVFHFSNRDELKEFIADRGGKVTGSVSAKTDYLINNDVTSTSSKNKKAAQLGIPILSEEDFLKLAGEA